MRILVTGGAGFIGSHVVDRLRAAGMRPRIFDRRVSEHHQPGEVETVVGDVLCLGDLRAALRGCDAVAHLAAAADVYEVAASPAAAEQLNARGTLNVLEAAQEAGVRRVIYASTIWVYSDGPAAVADEDEGLQLPSHLYTATKLAGEMYCKSYAELYGLEYTILRFGIPYGPRARPAAVIPAFVRNALAGEPLTIAGSGEQSRRFVYVEDLADGVVRALAPHAANRIFNLVGDESVSVCEIAATVRDVVGDVDVIHVPGRPADFGGVEVSGRRAAEELGWRASTPFAEGVRRYVAWHVAQAPAAPVPSPTPISAAPSHRGRGASRAIARRAGVAALVGSVAVVIAILLAAAGGLQAVNDQVDTATAAMLFVLPPLILVAAYDGTCEGWRVLTRLCWTLATAEVLAVLLPFHGHARDLAHDHAILLLLGAFGALAAAMVAATQRRAAAAAAAEPPGA